LLIKTPLQKIEKLESNIKILHRYISLLEADLEETKEALAQVAISQYEFVSQFESLIRNAQKTKINDTSMKDDIDTWN
jgi:FtsZ-binding cell division protein ZapB